MTMSLKKIIIALLSLVLLTVCFQRDVLHTASKPWFNDFQFDSESLVIGRLVQSREHGIFSNGGLLGRVGINGGTGDGQRYQSELFMSPASNHPPFSVYGSQVGAQGVLFSIVDRVLSKLGVAQKHKVSAMHAINSFMLAIILTYFLLFVLEEFGWFAAVSVLFSIVFSQWLVVMARNLYWCFWLMFLPFAISLWAHKREKVINHFGLNACVLVGVSVFLKSTTGYEYISAVMLAMLVPVVYFALNDQWGWRRTVIRCFYLGSAAVIGFILAIVLHIEIWGYVNNFNFMNSLVDIVHHAGSRMYAQSDMFTDQRWAEGASATIPQVLNLYWHGEAFNLFHPLRINYFNSIGFSDLLMLFMIFSALCFMSEQYSPGIAASRKKLFSLMAALWFSLLAPLSWFVLAKVHSYVHTHINYVLWSLPFTVIGFTLIGFVVALIYSDIKQKTGIGRRFYLILVSAVALIVVLIWFNGLRNYKNDMQLIESTKITTKMSSAQVEVIPLSNHKIAYINRNCRSADLNSIFFLHVYPAGPADISGLTDGFQNHDFRWDQTQDTSSLYSRLNNICYKIIKLPDFAAAGISTGQYVPTGRIWQLDFNLKE